MNNTETQERLMKLEGLKKRISDTKQNILSLLKHLEKRDEIANKNKKTTRITCPYNKSHLVGASKLKTHVLYCKNGPRQCSVGDQLFPENSNTDKTTVVTIDQNLCVAIISKAASNDPYFKKGIPEGVVDNRSVPLSHNQMITSFTADERRALYDYAVTKVPVKNNISEYIFPFNETKSENNSKHMSSLEELKMIRDMKRRRAKYKVSTKSKSYTEIMRGVIDNLMSSHREDLDELERSNEHKDKRSKDKRRSKRKSSGDRSSKRDIKKHRHS